MSKREIFRHGRYEMCEVLYWPETYEPDYIIVQDAKGHELVCRQARMLRPGTKHWDGTQALDYLRDDGGRSDAGFKGRAGDCVCRAVAIASGKPYAEVYRVLATGTGSQRATKRGKRAASARRGVNVRRKWFRDYMHSLGFQWVPTMQIGKGCKVHLLRGELPMGRLVVSVSKHYTTVIDGVIHDTHDPTRASIITENGETRMTHRCVYGYWTLQPKN